MFIKNYKDFLLEVRDKAVKHAGDKEEKNFKDGKTGDTDKELEQKLEDDLEEIAEDCPRCGEHIDACKCEEEDPWSTKVYHRAPRGEEYKGKAKQQFK